MMLVAWIPFLQPIMGLHSTWHLLSIPLVIGVSMIYKGVRVPEDQRWGRPVVIMSIQVILALVAVGISVAIFVGLILPQLAS